MLEKHLNLFALGGLAVAAFGNVADFLEDPQHTVLDFSAHMNDAKDS